MSIEKTGHIKAIQLYHNNLYFIIRMNIKKNF